MAQEMNDNPQTPLERLKARVAAKRANERAQRLAQFGGVGGGQTTNPWSPGNSPHGRSGAGSRPAANGVNDIIQGDFTLDSLMGNTRRGYEDNPETGAWERSWEMRLEPFHAYLEQDRVAYDLSKEDREKLSVRQQVRRREQWEKEEPEYKDTYTAKYLSRYQPTADDVIAFEDALETRREGTDDSEGERHEFQRYVDEVQPKAPRHKDSSTQHPRTAQRVNHPTGTIFDLNAGDGSKDPYANGDTMEDKIRHHNPASGWINNTPFPTTQNEVEQEFGDQSKSLDPWLKEQNLIDQPRGHLIRDPIRENRDPALPSQVADPKSAASGDEGTQGKLEQQRQRRPGPRPSRLPNYGEEWSLYDILGERDQAPKGINQSYGNGSEGPPVGNAPLPTL